MPDAASYTLRFRTTDALHRKGDILCGGSRPVFVGQTPECLLRLAPHPDWADACYAVIVPRGDGWCLIRQEKDADILVNGSPLRYAVRLSEGDILSFDRTVVTFRTDAADVPTAAYVHNRRGSRALWAGMAILLAAVVILAVHLYVRSLNPMRIFRAERASVYAVRVDSLLVDSAGVRIHAAPADHPVSGTGFVTEDGYFVTARHCLEHWLAEEAFLADDPEKAPYEGIRWAVRAEENPDLQVLTAVTVLDGEGREVAHYRSDAFAMDKSADQLYERGDYAHVWVWRSLVSRYSRFGAELGDLAVARWNGPAGTLRRSSGAFEEGATLTVIGFPAEEGGFNPRQDFKTHPGVHRRPDGCLVAGEEIPAGFSGSPVFARDGLDKQVVGIVSRTSDGYTLMVPASEIDRLITFLP